MLTGLIQFMSRRHCGGVEMMLEVFGDFQSIRLSLSGLELVRLCADFNGLYALRLARTSSGTCCLPYDTDRTTQPLELWLPLYPSGRAIP